MAHDARGDPRALNRVELLLPPFDRRYSRRARLPLRKSRCAGVGLRCARRLGLGTTPLPQPAQALERGTRVAMRGRVVLQRIEFCHQRPTHGEWDRLAPALLVHETGERGHREALNVGARQRRGGRALAAQAA